VHSTVSEYYGIPRRMPCATTRVFPGLHARGEPEYRRPDADSPCG
jgi:hypothetical protein